MRDRGKERRACERFVIPGAAVSYKKEALFLAKRFTEERYPIFDMSRGGLRFLSQKPFKINTRLSLKIEITGEEIPIIIKGRVKWLSINPEKSYKYQVGIQFDPYGKKKGENAPECLERLIVLERKFLQSS